MNTTGPFALHFISRPLLISLLEQRIILQNQSSRPAIKNEKKVFFIGIKGTDQKQMIKEEEKIFLNVIKYPSGGIENISFSSNPTDFCLICQSYKENSLLLRLIQNHQEEGEFILHQNDNHIDLSQENISLIHPFKEVKIWGKDKFFQQYGAAEYRQLGEKIKLEIPQGKNREFLYSGLNDYLLFSEGTWKVADQIDVIETKAPLAHVRFMGPGFFEINVWDENGFLLFQKQIKEENTMMQHFSPEQVFLTPKLRTAKQISCFIGKKRMLLKQGDWLMKTKTGWRTLRTSMDIENYLNHSLMGELFIFDNLEIKNGQYFLKGHWFNELHTIVQAVTFSINTEKKAKSKKKVFESGT